MRKFTKLAVLTALITFFTVSCVHNKCGHGKIVKKGAITMEINYGEKGSKESFKAQYTHGMTVLQALQSVAKVETYVVNNKYVFVTSINDVKGKRGVTAWYYNINGKSPGKLAFSKRIRGGDIIAWRYVKDVCSRRVNYRK